MLSEQNSEVVGQFDMQKQGVSSEEGQLEFNQTKVDDKENNNGLSAAQPTGIRYRKDMCLT